MKQQSLFVISIALYLLILTNTGTLSIDFDFESTPSRVIYEESSRVRGFKDNNDKDIIFGGLFAVHRPASGSANGRCSSDLIISGVERSEAFLYSIDRINSDPNLLPNITIGYDIRDTCVSENIALDETIELLFTENTDTLCSTNSAEDMSSSGFNNASAPTSVAAVIGPTTSQVSLSVASLLRLFTTPEVSYSVSSPTFNNRDRYGYFYRTHPSDSQEVQAMIDLAVEFNWTYITTIHSNNAYGEPAIDLFRQLAADKGICIDLDIGLDDDLTQQQYLEVATKVVNESTANVIVFFASLAYVEEFMEQFSSLQRGNKNSRSFLWIASTSWAQADSISTLYPDIITGLLGFEVLTKNESNFSSYFSQLTLESNMRNPWFTEYYEGFFNCIKDESCEENVPVTDNTNYMERNYIQLVIDATYSVAHALNNFLLDNCDQPIIWDSSTQTCAGQAEPLNGTQLRNYIQNVNFTSPSGNRVYFDANGNVEGQYKIINFQSNNNAYEFVSIGRWTDSGDQNRHTLFPDTTIQFGINQTSGEPLLSVESQCQRCPSGNFQVPVQSSCCGTCSPCLGKNYTNSSTNTECSICSDDEWGNNPLTGSNNCVNIKETYLDASDGFGIVLILLAVFGLICVLLVSIGMGIFWTTPVIKSSGREQMTLLLIGIVLSFLVTVFFIVRPSIAICLLQRVCTWFCFSLILSALFIKLIRIARIFLRGHNSKRPRFIQSKYQVVFTFLLVSIQMILVVISLLVVYPEATESIDLNDDNTLDSPTIGIQCSAPHPAVIIIQIIFYSTLLLATNILAVMTIQFPENFNEARYVAFATFSTLLIWVAFLQTYFAVDSSYQIGVVCFAIQLTSLAVLFCLFVPRLFILIVWPTKKNQQANNNSSNFQIKTTKISDLSKRKISADLSAMEIKRRDDSSENGVSKL